MAATGVKIVMDTHRVARAFKRQLEKTKSAGRRELWDDIGWMLLRSVDKNFKAEGRPDKWAPLHPDYAARKKKGSLILTETERLRLSIVHDPDPDGVDIGSNVEYAAIQHFGSKKKNHPARPFLVVQDEDEDAIVAAIEQFLVEAL